jgi:two-component sensor histidine kinase
VQALWLDRRSRQMLRFAADEAVGLDELLSRIHPDDEAPVRNAIELALESAAGGAYGIEFRLAGDGQRWVRAQGKVFQPGESGVFRSTRLVGTVQDITERKHTETRQRLLLQELSHRVKNTLAVVMSLARQTLRSAGGVPQLLARFEGRLQALSAAHDILVESDWRGADFLSLARRQLQVLVTDMSRVELKGPPLELPESLATPIGLLLHELATNAIKHGALSNEQGRVRLAWDVLPREQRSVLELCWREEGGPPVKPSATRGFGSAIIERSIPRAKVRREFGARAHSAR